MGVIARRDLGRSSILTPEQFERFARASFHATTPALREIAQERVIESYRSLYDSPLGRLWHSSQYVVDHAVAHWDGSCYEVPTRTFETFKEAVCDLTGKEGSA